jgi:hypothetical protein
MLAIPTFVTAEERAMDRPAESDLRVALSATRPCSPMTRTPRASRSRTSRRPSRTSGGLRNRLGAGERRLRVDAGVNYGEINVARLSESGVCFSLRTIDVQAPPRPTR